MQVHHIGLQLSQLLLTDFLHRIPRSFFVVTFSVKQHQQTISVAHQFPEKQFSLTNCSCHNQQLRPTAMMANLTEYESSTYTTQVFLLEDHLLALSKQKDYVFSLSLIKTNRQKVQNVANSSVFFLLNGIFQLVKLTSIVLVVFLSIFCQDLRQVLKQHAKLPLATKSFGLASEIMCELRIICVYIR